MTNKTIASVGLVAAAATGALLLTGSPASARTARTPAGAGAEHVRTSVVADHHHGYRWGHHRHYGYYHGNRHDGRIVISDRHTDVTVG